MAPVTSGYRDLPDFLVIGTKKGGTTSVANWLIQHRQVAPLFSRFEKHKSPHYFDINYWRGQRWYLSHFPARAVREVHRRRQGRCLVGETSPYYLFHPAAASRIHETAPTVKLIAILREPVSRAYSNYWDRVATGMETLTTFEAAVAAEERRLSGVDEAWLADPRHYSFSHDHHSYLARGHYAEQLSRYRAHFDTGQLLVLSADSLRAEPQRCFRRIEEFLGLDADTVDLGARNERSGNPPIKPETRERLREYYREPNRQLVELLGEDYGW